jgi:hypothetical protein
MEQVSRCTSGMGLDGVLCVVRSGYCRGPMDCGFLDRVQTAKVLLTTRFGGSGVAFGLFSVHVAILFCALLLHCDDSKQYSCENRR